MDLEEVNAPQLRRSIERYFRPGTIRQALYLVKIGRVATPAYTLDLKDLRATVNNFDVRVSIDPELGTLLKMSCSCWERECVHAAAVLFAFCLCAERQIRDQEQAKSAEYTSIEQKLSTDLNHFTPSLTREEEGDDIEIESALLPLSQPEQIPNPPSVAMRNPLRLEDHF